MAKGIAAPPLALLLAGCVTVPVASETYEALGTEPFWSIRIENGRMTYDTSNGGGFSVPAPAPQESGDGRIWRTPRITLHVRHAECRDGMSEQLYVDTVRAVVDGQTLEGCGGANREVPYPS